ncbi:glucosamine--fructose-6-phosphate aminotransferase [isomerizing] [Candidatus Vecturithrix granuli]|uniref:Glucosamine--fructose-6-phosphate aminotransferase [isomerizing] n=1 Tax=Vecturithrix granuli TaxID=1499967 RepID=A0A0S6WB18_VECG1|nr:glucosamine--fructose-6-phosphate aminotransferase [isomerizing] [Candidatus Vecturithrix granuli]
MALPRCITLVGPSGSGITTVLKELESMGYDIIQPTLLETLQDDEQRTDLHAYVPKIWDALDKGIPLEKLGEYARDLCREAQKCQGNITIFLQSELPTLTKRQEENRLKTRLSMEYNLPHQQALQIEQQVLQPFSEVAQIKLDTTHLSPILARRTISLLLNLRIPFETNSYEKLVDHVVSDFFRSFKDVALIQEILSQGDATRDFLNSQRDYVKNLDKERILQSNQRIFLVGEGSSLSSLQSAVWLLHKGYGLLLNTFRIPASDLRFTDITDAIVVICSNSGNTAEIKQNIDDGGFDAAKLAIGITNHEHSALGDYCKEHGVLFPLHVCDEKPIAATVSVSRSILTATAVLARIGELFGKTGVYDQIFEDATHLPGLLRDVFSQRRIDTIAYVAKTLARGMKDVRHGYITSAGLLSDCLLSEASLKAKELARVHLEPIFNSLFHGPLNPDVQSAIYLEDPLVTIDAMKKHIDKLNLYIPTVVTVGSHNFGIPHIFIPQTTPVNSLILHLVTLQLLYFLMGLESGFSLEEIQFPIRLSKVVLESPLV